MRRLATVLVAAVAWVAAGSVALADELPPPAPEAEAPPATEPAPPETEPPPPVHAPGDEAWATYDAAFLALARGHAEEALDLMTKLADGWPEHPAGLAARERIAAWATTTPVPEAPAPPPPRPHADGPSTNARGELVLWTTLSGAMLGYNLCVDRCESNRAWAGSLMLSTAAALGVTVLATRHGVHHGEAQLYNSSMTWGSWNALAFNDGFADTRREAGISIASQAGGLAAGVGLWRLWRPSAGDVAFTNTTFFWGTVLSLYAHFSTDSQPTYRRTVLAGDLGILAGALISTEVKMSRGRTLLIDVGGVLGTLSGGLIALAFDSEIAAARVMGVSTLAGLAIATVATRKWDASAAPAVRVAPARLPDNGWAGTVAFDF